MEFIIQIKTVHDEALAYPEAHVKTFGPAPDGKLPTEGDFIAMPLVYLPEYLKQISIGIDPEGSVQVPTNEATQEQFDKMEDEAGPDYAPFPD